MNRQPSDNPPTGYKRCRVFGVAFRKGTQPKIPHKYGPASEQQLCSLAFWRSRPWGGARRFVVTPARSWVLPHAKGSTHEAPVHFRPARAAFMSEGKIPLDLKPSRTAPLGAPAWKLLRLSFACPSSFALARLFGCHRPFLCRPRASAGARAAGELQLERSGGRARHGRTIYCT